MDPNNNQPTNTNPLGQPAVPQPVGTPFSSPVPPVQQPPPAPAPTITTPAPTPQAPKSAGKKGIILIIILLILIVGMGFYVFFVKNQLNTIRKSSTDNTSTVIPTVTIAPTVTPASVDEINVASPDADLKGIEKDVQGL